MLASAGTLLLPSPEQASCLQPPPSSTSAIGRRVLQDPPARPTLSIAAQSGKGSKPSLGNHSNSMKFLLLTPLLPPPPPAPTFVLAPLQAEEKLRLPWAWKGLCSVSGEDKSRLFSC